MQADVSKWSNSGCRRLPRRASSRAFCHAYSHTYSRGAILPIGIFFLAVLCVGIFAVYNMAQVTSDKRRLVNAADAIAYSTANIAAEGLNYTAYTNRAMIANYQAVGQMTAMWSNVTMSDQYWKNNSKVMKATAALTK